MREIMDAAAFREMFLCANAALEENKQTINELNVFPVPDGDTGTNMAMTINNASRELSVSSEEELSSVANICKALIFRKVFLVLRTMRLAIAYF